MEDELILVVHDIFDSYSEYIEMLQEIIKKQVNKKILLFNIPGFCSFFKSKHEKVNPTQFMARSIIMITLH